MRWRTHSGSSDVPMCSPSSDIPKMIAPAPGVFARQASSWAKYAAARSFLDSPCRISPRGPRLVGSSLMSIFFNSISLGALPFASSSNTRSSCTSSLSGPRYLNATFRSPTSVEHKSQLLGHRSGSVVFLRPKIALLPCFDQRLLFSRDPLEILADSHEILNCRPRASGSRDRLPRPDLLGGQPRDPVQQQFLSADVPSEAHGLLPHTAREAQRRGQQTALPDAHHDCVVVHGHVAGVHPAQERLVAALAVDGQDPVGRQAEELQVGPTVMREIAPRGMRL